MARSKNVKLVLDDRGSFLGMEKGGVLSSKTSTIM